jgi:hypothetical protein
MQAHRDASIQIQTTVNGCKAWYVLPEDGNVVSKHIRVM